MLEEIQTELSETFGAIGQELSYILKMIFKKAWQLLVFIFLSIIFIPSFLIVTWCTKKWNELLGELFGL